MTKGKKKKTSREYFLCTLLLHYFFFAVTPQNMYFKLKQLVFVKKIQTVDNSSSIFYPGLPVHVLFDQDDNTVKS